MNGRMELNTERPDGGSEGMDYAKIDFPAAALYLATTYKNLLTEKRNIESMLDGHTVFTEDMAIEELMSMTASSEGEHVQTSGLSDQTARIAEKLAAGYVEKRRRQLQREAEAMASELGYINWKTGIVDAAMENRMTRNDAAFFRLMFVKGKSYREIRNAYKRGNIYDHDVKKRKDQVLQAVADQIQLVSCMEAQKPFVWRLVKEVEKTCA